MTSLMRQRALQKKLAKVNEAALKQKQDAGENNNKETGEEAPKSSMTAKALARQRLLKKKQMAEQGEDGGDEVGAQAAAQMAEELAAQRAAEESAKLKLAKQEGGLNILQLVFDKMKNAVLNAVIVSWVENLGEAMVLQEEQDEAALAEEDVLAELAAEEELDSELELLMSQINEAPPEGEDLKQKFLELQEFSLKQTQQCKNLQRQMVQAEEEILAATARADAKEAQSVENMEKFRNTNRELAKVQRELLTVKSGKGGGGGEGSQAGSRSEQEKMLTEMNRDLAQAQRQVLALKQQLEGKGGGGGNGGQELAAAKRDLEKLKKSVATTNKELSEAQYSILAQREQFKDLQELVEELDEVVPAGDEKAKKLISQVLEKLDEALEEEEDEE